MPPPEEDDNNLFEGFDPILPSEIEKLLEETKDCNNPSQNEEKQESNNLDYIKFLQSFEQNHEDSEEEDKSDNEYDFNPEERENPLDEEYRTDPAVTVSNKELHSLLYERGLDKNNYRQSSKRGRKPKFTKRN